MIQDGPRLRLDATDEHGRRTTLIVLRHFDQPTNFTLLISQWRRNDCLNSALIPITESDLRQILAMHTEHAHEPTNLS